MRSELQALSAASKALMAPPRPPASTSPSKQVAEQMSKLQAGVLAHTQAVATFERSRKAAEDALRRAAASVSSTPMTHAAERPLTSGSLLSFDRPDFASPSPSPGLPSSLPTPSPGPHVDEAARDLERGLALAAEAAEREKAMGTARPAPSPMAFFRAATPGASVRPLAAAAAAGEDARSPNAQASIDSRLLGAAIERASELSMELETCRGELAEAQKASRERDGLAAALDEAKAAAEEERAKAADLAKQLAESRAAEQKLKEELAALRAKHPDEMPVVQAEDIDPADPPMPLATATFDGVPVASAEPVEPGAADPSAAKNEMEF